MKVAPVVGQSKMAGNQVGGPRPPRRLGFSAAFHPNCRASRGFFFLSLHFPTEERECTALSIPIAARRENSSDRGFAGVGGKPQRPIKGIGYG